MAELRNRIRTTPEKLADVATRVAQFVGHPDARGVGQRLADAYNNMPVIGSLQQAVGYAERKAYGPAAIMAGAAALSFNPVTRALASEQTLAKLALAPGGNRYLNAAIRSAANTEGKREDAKRAQFAAANRDYERAHMMEHADEAPPPESGNGRKGFANPNNQKAAQEALGRTYSGGGE